MASFSARFDRTLADLAWSLWTELGVRGIARRHEAWSIDPEALVVLTAAIAAADPRLRDEALDWCVRFQHHLSRSRLKTLEREMGVAGWDQHERFVGTIARHGSRQWPTAADPFPFEPSVKSDPPDLRRPALLRLRLRAIFGVSARSEVLHAFIADPTTWTTAADLASAAGYTKRNVLDALEGLEETGVVDGSASGNRRLYRPAAPSTLSAFVAPIPEHFPDWRTLVHVLVSIMRAADAYEELAPRVRDVEASKQLDEIRRLTNPTELAEGPPEVGDGWAGLTAWGLRLAERLANAAG